MAKFFGLVFGSQPEQPKALEVNVDTVYVRNNIERVEKEDFEGWQYEETQYNLKEFQEVVGKDTDNLKGDVEVVADIVTVTMEDTLAIAELIAEVLDMNSALEARIEELENTINGGNV